VPDATFEPIETRRAAAAVVIFVLVAFIDDLALAMFAASLNNGDAPDELVHGLVPGFRVQ
jgi:hypothetical protein